MILYHRLVLGTGKDSNLSRARKLLLRALAQSSNQTPAKAALCSFRCLFASLLLSVFGRVAFAPYFPRTMEPSSERGERFVCLFQLARQSLGQKNHPVFPMKEKVQVSRCHTKGKLSRRYQPLFPNPRCGATQVTRQREVRCFISPRDIMLDR